MRFNFDEFNMTDCVCVFLSPFDGALEVWLADGVVVYEDCGTGAVLLRQRAGGNLGPESFHACIN